MFGYFLLFQVFVIVAARPSHDDDIFEELTQNDANLNEGFDLNAFRVNQLNLHNYYRNKHGVPLMTLDNDLTQQAQEYAEELAANNVGLVHCSNVQGCDNHHAGENLAAAWGSTTVESNATKAWYNEIWDYNFCTGGTRPGHEGKPIGHFTQVVWKKSTKLGIGYARTSDKEKVYVVGRYFEHGNVRGTYLTNVLKPNDISDKYQDNCLGINGALSAWSAPGTCTQSCDGGVKLKTRTCTNPKPSLNGADCVGETKELAAEEWCNVESCPGDMTQRDKQCEARGHTLKSSQSSECVLYCLQIVSGKRIYMREGVVDDGTHCKKHNGACVSGTCESMPLYSAPTEPPPTSATGQIVGSYTETPSSNVWSNVILKVPNGATDVTITNKKYKNVEILAGYEYSHGKGYSFAEASWMDSWVDYQGHYTTTRTIKGVTFEYKRISTESTFTITGPVEPTSGYTFILFVQNAQSSTQPADITWSYTL